MTIQFSGSGNPVTVDGTNYGLYPTLMTAQSTSTGSATPIDFTGIPSWVRRITFIFNGVSVSGTSNFLIRLGTSTGFETTLYESSADLNGISVTDTTGVIVRNLAAANIISGHVVFTLVSGNTWVYSGVVRPNSGVAGGVCGGYKPLSSTLTQIRLTTVNGTDTFDFGSVNVMYE